MHVFCFHWAGKRTLVALDFLQHRVDLFEHSVIEPGSGLADVDKMFLIVIEAQNQ
jgi:hypothetical protein